MKINISHKKTIRYVPIKFINGEAYYYNGANILGRDKDGILRIWNTKWSKYYSSVHSRRTEKECMDIIVGILKYDYLKGEDYGCLQVVTNTDEKGEVIHIS